LIEDGLPRATARLVLRRFAATDLAPFQAYRGEPRVARYQGWTAMDDAAAAAFIADMAVAAIGVRGEWFQIAIADRPTDWLVGDIGIGFDAEREGVAEIGFSLAPSAQGRGLASEAVAAALALLFESLRVDVVEGVTDTRNLPSIRLLERVGMRRIRTHDTLFRGEACREHLYSLARADWRPPHGGAYQ
jgi:aminoglycoside 6'-N-acetyltransferase